MYFLTNVITMHMINASDVQLKMKPYKCRSKLQLSIYLVLGNDNVEYFTYHSRLQNYRLKNY